RRQQPQQKRLREILAAIDNVEIMDFAGAAAQPPRMRAHVERRSVVTGKARCNQEIRGERSGNQPTISVPKAITCPF
ncbi:hypothetical protein INQ23_30730, partial [Escherichia coli]|nr:hypothetical protein [Escherichia coli]